MSRRLLVVQHQDDVPLGRLTFPGLAVDVVRPDRGDALPRRLDEHAGLVVLGGRMSAWEDGAAPWLPAVRELLAACVGEEAPVLGICLGAQLLAMAAGGRVERGAAGPELGVVHVEATPQGRSDPLLAGLGHRWPVAQSHQDAVAVLPTGAVLLARSSAYPHQAFRIGPAAWGVQYHPEATTDAFAGWMQSRRAVLAGQGRTPADAVAGMVGLAGELAAVAAAHGTAFARAVHTRARHGRRPLPAPR